jgi:hypothetical protein
MFVEWLEEYEKPDIRAIPRLLKKLWQIYEFSVPGSSWTPGSAIWIFFCWNFKLEGAWNNSPSFIMIYYTANATELFINNFGEERK